MQPMTPKLQMQAQARARREEIRHEKQEGMQSEIRCWQDEPEECESIPVFHILQLDGACYYTCRAHAEELVDNLPDIPFENVDAKIH